jgi:hypothetical protein
LKEKANGLVPTSGREWREAREKGFVVMLPSGRCVRMQPVSLEKLIISSQIPDTLVPLAAASIWAGVDPEKDKDDPEVMRKLLKESDELFGIICRASFMEPKIVDDPQEDNEIHIDDLEFRDKVRGFEYAQLPSVSLHNFREEQEKLLAALRNGEDDGAAAEQAG